MKAWWPNGYGQPVLYDGVVVFSDSQHSEVDCHNFRIGFRTVELVQQSVSARQPGQLSDMLTLCSVTHAVGVLFGNYSRLCSHVTQGGISGDK